MTKYIYHKFESLSWDWINKQCRKQNTIFGEKKKYKFVLIVWIFNCDISSSSSRTRAYFWIKRKILFSQFFSKCFFFGFENHFFFALYVIIKYIYYHIDYVHYNSIWMILNELYCFEENLLSAAHLSTRHHREVFVIFHIISLTE